MCNSLEIINNPLVTDFISVLFEDGEIRTYQITVNKSNSKNKFLYYGDIRISHY